MQCKLSLVRTLTQTSTRLRTCLAAALLIVAAQFALGWNAPANAAINPSKALQVLRAQDTRVALVAYRLALVNRDFCAKATSPQLGFVLHAIEQYDPSDRDRVITEFGLGEHVGVMAIVPDSPAGRAGLRANDQIISVNGKAFAGGPGIIGEAPTRARVGSTEQTILGEMQKGPVTLSVTGALGRRDIAISPESGCSGNVELLPGNAVNAWADGQGVVIGAGLLALCQTDADLAFVIAHEMAHNILGHNHRLAANDGSGPTMLSLRGSGLAVQRETEEEADRLAITLTAGAGYKVSGAESFLSRLLNGRDGAANIATHPATERRLGLLRSEVSKARSR